ncbi:hypothetical protein [Providencia huaxiensis]|uniref:hypothetical protein n=1 Tax=Providencia huaxiensis TaxID=2027290 RepID=UPI0032DBDAC5
MNIQHMIECGKIFKVGDIISSVRISKEVGKSVNISGQTVRQLAKIGAAQKKEKIGIVTYYEVIRNIQDAINDELERRRKGVAAREYHRNNKQEPFNYSLVQKFNKSIARARA